ncbi:hypothetical protein COV12_00115 [Candidatus Woesearchaeota archaeon CG10_big_fil_rev_8_21_14_0_10_32_24]|nr:MAG: hypothetical protein COV12_00115 [Candidatus Woesearchaeota archaeon CG10_big_fil_rev_8_21_14_0_10_32_24]
MAKISKELIKEFVKKDFFDKPKSTEEVIKKLDSKGFSIKGKKIGLVAQLLTLLCQEGVLEREGEKRNYKYKKNE